MSNKIDTDNYIILISLGIIVGVVVILFMFDPFSPYENKTNITLTDPNHDIIEQCKVVSYDEHFSSLKSFTLFTNYTIISKGVKEYNVVNNSLITYVCKADIEACYEGLRLCLKSELYTDVRNYTRR